LLLLFFITPEGSTMQQHNKYNGKRIEPKTKKLKKNKNNRKKKKKKH